MSNGELILYTSEDGQSHIQLKAMDGTVWLTQSELAELFLSTKQNISLHLKNIFEEGELDENSVVKEYLTTASDGKNYNTKFYNLEAILAVGYRVKSPRGTQFRQWATTTLREYLVKGFVLNDERLKEPGGWDYFDELLERIREIRTSEKRFYQKVKDLFATSVDYDGRSETAQLFFKTVQNKMLWAVTGKTAAELIVERGNPELPNMGLTTWKGSKVRKGDIVTSKNYLTQEEVSDLNLMVSAFLEMAEARARRRQSTTMKEWETFVDDYLKLSEREILKNAGSISAGYAERIANERYEVFDANRKAHERQLAEQDYELDLEAEIKQLEGEVKKRLPGQKRKKEADDV